MIPQSRRIGLQGRRVQGPVRPKVIELEYPTTSVLVQIPVGMRAPRIQSYFGLRIGHPPCRGFVCLVGITLFTCHPREPVHDSQQCKLIQWIGISIVAVRPPQLAVPLPAGHKRFAFHVSKRRVDPPASFAVHSGHEQRRMLRAVCVTPVLDHVVGVCPRDRHVVIRSKRCLPRVTLVQS